MSRRRGPSRRKTIGAAAALAAGFVAVRIAYRVLFHGADGDGPVVLPLPLWRLPAPFAHVQILGPATVDGLRDAALSAVPIAATILAFGVLNALLDLPALLARAAGRGPLQGIARALSIAWATLPALADAVRAARFARRLRGERPGVRLLAPVLERTLERATAVAASLEVRGYGASPAAGLRGPGSSATGAPPPLPNPYPRAESIPTARVHDMDSVAGGGFGGDRKATEGEGCADAAAGVRCTGAAAGGADWLPTLEARIAIPHDSPRVPPPSPNPYPRVESISTERSHGMDSGVEGGFGDNPENAHTAAATGVEGGFGDNPGSAHTAAGTVVAHGVVATHAGAAVRVADLRLDAGTLVLLTGPTGSGKTTLLRAISGLHTHLDGGRLEGRLDVAGRDRSTTPPRDTARSVGVVLQHPREGFIADAVADEIGFTLELHGVPATERRERVREVAHRVGIDHLLDRSTRELSAGEAVLVAIAAAIVHRPALLLVDEPLADLDDTARTRIVALVRSLAREGACVVVAEHRTDALGAVADLTLRVAAGAVTALTGEVAPAALEPSVTRMASAPDPGPTPAAPPVRPPVLTASALTVRHGNRIAVDGASLTLRPGEIVALTGPNGAGKSSLLTALALGCDGVHVEGSRPRAVALVPEVADDLFVRDTVAAECRAADRRARIGRRHGTSGGPDADTSAADRFAALLGLDPRGATFSRVMSQHPRDLSAGERRCLAIVLQTAHRPRVLLVDEPTRGLDADAVTLVAGALAAQARDGRAVLLATHDSAVVNAVCDRMLSMRGGVLEPGQSLRETAERRSSASGQPMGADALFEHDRAATPDSAPAGYSRRGAVRPSEHRRSAQHAQLAGPVDLGRAAAPTEPAERGGPARSTFVGGAEKATPAGGAARTPAASAVHTAASGPQPRHRLTGRAALLVAANLAAAAAFLWPLVASAVPAQAQAAVPYIALALAPVAAILVVAALDRSVRSAHTLALLAVLAAIGAAIRIASTGVGGVEALFVLLILAGRAYGARFGLLVGAASIALSALVWGGVGPWLPFQMFACGWIAAGAGMLPRRVTGWREVVMLCAYGVVASYLFGLIMNMWFWPFAVGSQTSISYVPGGSIAENLANFLVYSLVTSTASWDTLRAVTTVIGLSLVGAGVLSALRRAKPITPAPAP